MVKVGDNFDQNQKLTLTADKFSSVTKLEQNFDVQINVDHFVMQCNSLLEKGPSGLKVLVPINLLQYRQEFGDHVMHILKE